MNKQNLKDTVKNHQAVITDFSKALELRNKELDECLDYLYDLLGEWEYYNDTEAKSIICQRNHQRYMELKEFTEILEKRYRVNNGQS